MWQIYQNRLLNRILSEITTLKHGEYQNIHKAILRKAQAAIGADHVFKIDNIDVVTSNGNIQVDVSFEDLEPVNTTIH